MHIKCLRRGTGSAGKAAAYLVGERDAMGREREGVEVLRGDPDMVAAVADSLDFELRDAFQPRARLEPAGRPGAGEDAATRPPRLHRGGEPAGRPGARGRPARVDP